MTERTKCAVRDGLFVEPCATLAAAVDNSIPGFSKAKGIFRRELTNMATGEPARTYFGIKTKEFSNGILFNHCPWCGESIDGPFMEKKDQ